MLTDKGNFSCGLLTLNIIKMTAKEFLEKDRVWKRIDDKDITKQALIEFAEEYHAEQLKLHDVSKSVCEHKFDKPDTGMWKFCIKCSERFRQ